ncbi:hypothetical protein E4U60_005659 [Claviceps pazoutovae]|uniref:Uncharacterized protein n=1 Tax=Claviceps pazoutovae TaxID=1649127 RepID=A0A9P7M7I0_9HYPO|nr:hypothetical protein E4U60_005659 [Claviceps pazoutovae]
MFADCYGVAGLPDLAIQKLRKALCGLQLSRVRVGDIPALVRFCYERSGSEKLKRLVASYSAAILDSESTMDHFREMLKEKTDFAAHMALLLGYRL